MTSLSPGHSPPQVTIPTRVFDGSKKIFRRGLPYYEVGDDGRLRYSRACKGDASLGESPRGSPAPVG